MASGKLEKQPTTEELFKSIEDNFPLFGLAKNVELQVSSISLLSPFLLVFNNLSYRRRIDYGKL